MTRRNYCLLPLLTAPALLLGGVTSASAADASRSLERTFAATAGRTISLENLSGNVTIVKSSGAEIRLSGTVHAAAGTAAEAEALAGMLKLDVQESSDRVSVLAKYPLDKHRKYSYPRGRENALPWFLAWLDMGSTSSTYDGVKVRVVSERAGDAPTLYADFRIEVPAGISVSVDGLIGELRATGVEGAVDLEVGSGLVESRNGRGELEIETGSGDVEVNDQQGTVRAESGSGDMRFEGVRGDRLTVETGSGDIVLRNVDAALSAESGSGDISAEGLASRTSLRAETGSGDIRLSGDLSALTRLDCSTGSGDVTLSSSAAPQLKLSVSTGSGDIQLDLPSARITRNDRHDVRADIGGATGTGSISTGSGDVSVRAAR